MLGKDASPAFGLAYLSTVSAPLTPVFQLATKTGRSDSNAHLPRPCSVMEQNVGWKPLFEASQDMA